MHVTVTVLTVSCVEGHTTPVCMGVQRSGVRPSPQGVSAIYSSSVLQGITHHLHQPSRREVIACRDRHHQWSITNHRQVKV